MSGTNRLAQVGRARHVHLRPVDGRLVRDPHMRQPIAESGERKPLDTFWRRRVRSGDVEVVDMSARAVTLSAAKAGEVDHG